MLISSEKSSRELVTRGCRKSSQVPGEKLTKKASKKLGRKVCKK